MEEQSAVTDAAGLASVAVTPTRAIGESSFSVSWDGLRLTANANGIDGAPLAGKAVTFYVEEKVRGVLGWTMLATVSTNADGTAAMILPIRYVAGQTQRRIRAVFDGDLSFIESAATALTFREQNRVGAAGPCGPAAPVHRCG